MTEREKGFEKFNLDQDLRFDYNQIHSLQTYIRKKSPF